MPEFTTVDSTAPRSPPKEGGPPGWLLYGGAAVVGLGLFMYLRRTSGSGANSNVPTQTQTSLAVGDLAYQVQSGLGALGVQNARNQQSLTNQLAEGFARIVSGQNWLADVEGQNTAEIMKQNTDYAEWLANLNTENLRYYLTPAAGYSALGYAQPVVSSAGLPHT